MSGSVHTDARNLRIAFDRVSHNKGRATAGVDGVTVRRILDGGSERFIEQIRNDLRAGVFRPSPVRRVLIPKRGQPGKVRPLGIPTVNDRVVQMAMKNILEPIFEADFYPTSYGFRPGKSVHGALEHLRLLMHCRTNDPRAEDQLPYQWAIEGDIKGCFDNIDHHLLMERMRQRIRDAKVNRLVVAFLKAGILAEAQFLRAENGTPQGGVLSPLLANIALGVLDERYERYVWPRRTPGRWTGTPVTDPEKINLRARKNRATDKPHGTVFVPIRYADDFVVVVSAPPGPRQFERAKVAALKEKSEIAVLLRKHVGVELSESKTLVTPVTEKFRFLGHDVRVRPKRYERTPICAAVIPKEASLRLRERIKDLFRRRTMVGSLLDRLRVLNPLLRGWANFYRHAYDAYRVFNANDHYVWHTIYRWCRKKHGGVSPRLLIDRYARRGPRGLEWNQGGMSCFRLTSVATGHFKLRQQHPPAYAEPIYGEPGA